MGDKKKRYILRDQHCYLSFSCSLTSGVSFPCFHTKLGASLYAVFYTRISSVYTKIMRGVLPKCGMRAWFDGLQIPRDGTSSNSIFPFLWLGSQCMSIVREWIQESWWKLNLKIYWANNNMIGRPFKVKEGIIDGLWCLPVTLGLISHWPMASWHQ